MKPFVHLHTHSHYSLLDGLSNVQEMVKLAKKYGMPALAITDHGAMYGAIEFYKACQKEGIKPIIGLEAYVANGSRHDKRSGVDNRRFHLTLLAQNVTGYRNLIQLVSKAHLEGFYYKPRVDKELLREHKEGLIALSGCMAGELSRTIAGKNTAATRAIIAEYQDIFGKDNYFLEIMYHPGVEGYAEIRAATIELSRQTGVPLVATQDSHYLHKDDARAHETLLAVQQGTDVENTNRLSFANDDFSFIDTETAYKYFADVPEAVERTSEIAERCTIDLKLGSWVFPDYKVPQGVTHDMELRRLAYEGLSFRGIAETPEIKERIDYELSVIQGKGYSPYFLVVGDLLRFARENGILTNTRGSAAGSLVSYLLGITSVDPLRFDLPFERFLNPDRPSAPDIDMDFADNRRDEVIAYARKKYGENHVAQIGTFGTMMARGAVRDVARALGHPYDLGDRIAKQIPFGSQGFPMTIEHAFEISPDLKMMHDKEEAAREILDLAKRLEGTVRHVSVHAAGVVIAPGPVTDYTPVQLDPGGSNMITQYDMYAVEDVGLLKLDFLGIRNLAILADAINLVEKYRGQRWDVHTIPLDDKKTFEMLSRGETAGVFQLNGDGMTRSLVDLKPTTVHDINLMVALYRPGPMDNINEYIARKHGRTTITYPHPKMKSFLERTYGVLVYQDDLLMTAIEVAGYSWGEVDKFRKAVGKKIPEEMAKQHKIFVLGCEKHSGMKKEEAEALWRLFEPFQGYGFNKAHAASYGVVAYQTAFMKANYPAEYMTAVLTAEAGDIEKVAGIIADCTRMGISVLPPNVNESFTDFTVIKGVGEEGDKIRFGLLSIKNFGQDIAEAVILERESKGSFQSYADFLERMNHKNMNKKSLESLIKAGALDELVERGTALGSLETALAYNREHARNEKAQSSLFGLMENKTSVPQLRLPETEPLSEEQKLAWEKELLGLYISGNPLKKHEKRLKELQINITKVKNYRDGVTTLIGGIILEAKPIMTKKGEQMAFLKVADFNDSIEVVVFPSAFSKYKSLLEADKQVLMKGRVSRRNGEPSLVVESIKEL
ncbi:MAG: DNA polymerase III subunit alpha [Parcubacteria group bacterium]|nr:DNA polymerase III subunit alpha [Parcubacteria group bacterium]